LFIGIAPVVGFYSLSSLIPWIVVCGGLLFELTRSLTQVFLSHDLNSQVTSEIRATANSLISFANRLAVVLVGPYLGYLIEKKGLSYSFREFSAYYVL